MFLYGYLAKIIISYLSPVYIKDKFFNLMNEFVIDQCVNFPLHRKPQDHLFLKVQMFRDWLKSIIATGN